MNTDKNLETGPSNSRLSVNFREHSHFLSWDKITVIGELIPRHEKEFQQFIATNPYVSVLDAKTDLVKAQLFNNLFYLEYDKIKGKTHQRRNMRIEFNPNYCSEDARQFFVKHLVRLMSDVGFSRLDLALDIDKNLKSFYVASNGSSKHTVFYGRDGSPETKYFGVRESDRYIRLYNKKQERKDNADEEVTAADLWRLEFELKRGMVDQWETIADDLIIKQPDWHSIADIRTRSFVYMLLHEEDQWGELSRPVKAKYRKIIREMEGEDLTVFVQQAIKNEATRLRQQLENWTGHKLI